MHTHTLGEIQTMCIHYRNLEKQVGVAKMSTTCQSELQKVQKELKAQLEVEQGLREALQRAKDEGCTWKEELTYLKGQQVKQDSEVVRMLEQRVQKLEHQLKEAEHSKGRESCSAAIEQFQDLAEAFIQTPVDGGHDGYIALEPVYKPNSSETEDTEKWAKLLENILGKHFDQLDTSLQNILSPNIK